MFPIWEHEVVGSFCAEDNFRFCHLHADGDAPVQGNGRLRLRPVGENADTVRVTEAEF
jgi:hypothetical protein